MAENPLQSELRRILDEEPSHVGELAYATEEELARSFGKLMCATSTDGTGPDELVRRLDAFGDALRRVNDRLARVRDYYDHLQGVARRHGADRVGSAA